MANKISQGFIEIQSTELFFLENELADIGSRAFAYIIDLFIRIIFIIGLNLALSSEILFRSSLSKIFLPIIIVWWMGYFVIFEFFTAGKTPGKRIVGIRVLKSDGSNLSFLDSCVRNIMRVVDMLPFGYSFAIIIMLFERLNRRIGDITANTIVIYDRSTNKSIKDFVKKMLIDSKPRQSVQIKGVEQLNQNDRLIIKNLYSRLGTMKDENAKKKLMIKFHEKISKRIKVEGTDDPEIILCELYKRI